jgi:hypothetical protein
MIKYIMPAQSQSVQFKTGLVVNTSPGHGWEGQIIIDKGAIASALQIIKIRHEKMWLKWKFQSFPETESTEHDLVEIMFSFQYGNENSRLAGNLCSYLVVKTINMRSTLVCQALPCNAARS